MDKKFGVKYGVVMACTEFFLDKTPICKLGEDDEKVGGTRGRHGYLQVVEGWGS